MAGRCLKIWLVLLTFLFVVVAVNQVEARSIQKDDDGLYSINNGDINWSFRLQSGYLTGTATEIVYQTSSSNALLSELTWEIDELYMAGFGVSFQRKWVALHFDLWIDAVDGDGTMDDYDWMVSGQDWTDWSHHEDTIISDAQMYDLNAEFIIPKLSGNKFIFSGFLGYKKESFQWESRGGSYIYTTVTFRDTVGNFIDGQKAITYKQTFSTPYLGIGLRGSIGKFELAARVIGSRWAEFDGRDHHHMRYLSIHTKMDDGDMLSGDIELSYNFTKHLSLALAYSYTKYDTMRDSATYSYLGGPVFTYENGQGADLETSLLSLAFVYSF